MNFNREISIAETLGIKVKYMTVYKAELINLRNDHKSIKYIANLVGKKEDTVGRWFTREAQPKKEDIEILEYNYFKRVGVKIDFENIKKIAIHLGIKY